MLLLLFRKGLRNLTGLMNITTVSAGDRQIYARLVKFNRQDKAFLRPAIERTVATVHCSDECLVSPFEEQDVQNVHYYLDSEQYLHMCS